MYFFMIAGVGTPNAPRGSFVHGNGASPQMTSSMQRCKRQGHAGNLGSSPRAWLGMCIELTWIIFLRFAGVSLPRSSAILLVSVFLGLARKCLYVLVVCCASVSETVILCNEISGIS